MENFAFSSDVPLETRIEENMTQYGSIKGPKTASEAFDLILVSVGGSGKYQWKLAVITGFCGLFTSLHNLGAVFLAASPDYWCRNPELTVNASIAFQVQNLTSPGVTNKDGHHAPSKCTYNAYNYSELVSLENINEFVQDESPEIKKCSSWFYDKLTFDSTLVSEWDLVCDRRYLMSAVQSTYMFGILIGAVVMSAVSDKIGRRRATLICTVIFFSSAILAGFSVSLEMFYILRFFTAAAGQGMYLVNFVIIMEAVQQKGRTWLPGVFGAFFSIGTSFLPGLSYFFTNWRNLQFFTATPTLLLFSYFWILPESPRWLCMQGRFEEGMVLLQEMAKANGGTIPPKQNLDIYFDVISKESFKTEKHTGLKKIKEIYESIATLVRTPNMRRRNLITFYGWFVVSSVFYGLTFSGYNLNMSSHMLVFLVAIVGLVTLPLRLLVLQRIGRRWTLSLAMTLCGLSCLAVLVIPSDYVWILMTVTIFGRLMSSYSFLVLFIFSSELVPTNVRNMSMGIASMWGRIGSLICPFIVDLLGEIYYAIPSGIFGILALLSGILSLLLPETGFRSLPESVEEVESMPK